MGLGFSEEKRRKKGEGRLGMENRLIFDMELKIFLQNNSFGLLRLEDFRFSLHIPRTREKFK